MSIRHPNNWVGDVIDKSDEEPLQDYFYLSNTVLLIRDSKIGELYALGTKFDESGNLANWRHENADVNITDFLITWKLDVNDERANIEMI